MGLGIDQFDLAIDASEPRKTLRFISPKNVLSQRRPTHQEASTIYFMAKEDIIMESLAKNKAEARQSLSHKRSSAIINDDPVTSPKASPRPILNKLGGGFRNNAFRNTIASVIELNESMFLTVNSGLEKVVST